MQDRGPFSFTPCPSQLSTNLLALTFTNNTAAAFATNRYNIKLLTQPLTFLEKEQIFWFQALH